MLKANDAEEANNFHAATQKSVRTSGFRIPGGHSYLDDYLMIILINWIILHHSIMDKIDNSSEDDAKMNNNQKHQAMHQHPLSHLETSGVRPDFPPSGVFSNNQD